MKKDEQLIAAAVIVNKQKTGLGWFLVKTEKDSEWEVPKTKVRRGESSVAAAIRMVGEYAGMRARVLEEAGRFSGHIKLNGREITQKHIYYLMTQKGDQENLGFMEMAWFNYAQALRKVSSAKEKRMIKQAKEVLTEWQKAHPKSSLA